MLPTTIKDNSKLMLPTTIKDNTKSGKKINWRPSGWLVGQAGQLETSRASKGSPFCLVGQARLCQAKTGQADPY